MKPGDRLEIPLINPFANLPPAKLADLIALGSRLPPVPPPTPSSAIQAAPLTPSSALQETAPQNSTVRR